MIIIAITGASGVIYSLKLLEALKKLNIETGVVVSKPAELIFDYELGIKLDEIKELANYFYEPNDLTSSINSGSFKFDSLVIVPCSMKTLSAIANGYGNNAITRVADVALKEKRKTILVPRETPLRSIHLENMLEISREGGIILPAMPGFYHNPENIDDIINFVVGKILDSLNIENELFKRWE
ncbi:MAG: UbiX family flavin prenyltransferase [Methanobrevibacter arboriphilus]|jgi:4-hydroxy-3-polyprenylbenzoate decarboxylase|uniref:Aromatic acid decarboxylase n=2 Tax=Methanobrevibacter arboriphilus TaxID=39441 RepID=A0ACA8R0M5_METAZ|nr:UbiX family flavin prenyltransferase [Methanobrevibacter arboriphilus]MBF4468683.1 UbiX family flavin prenyltransferase [Methanobrevibacter arboriphilus]BBL61003.1 aromatic acid decarboxylase [Methanobrevibacter arboriphilus]GLI12654.1 aromatic acid decarboxylase [Methanobrevibacter arboriphilus]